MSCLYSENSGRNFLRKLKDHQNDCLMGTWSDGRTLTSWLRPLELSVWKAEQVSASPALCGHVGLQECSFTQARTCRLLAFVAFVSVLGPSGLRRPNPPQPSPTAPFSFVGRGFSTTTSIQEKRLNCTSYSFSLLCFLDFKRIFFSPTEHGRLNRLLWASLGTLFSVKNAFCVGNKQHTQRNVGNTTSFVEWGLPVQSHASGWEPLRVLFSNLDSSFFFLF